MYLSVDEIVAVLNGLDFTESTRSRALARDKAIRDAIQAVVDAGPAKDVEAVMTVRLDPVDADHILALAEWALNHVDLDLGPGLRPYLAEAAVRKIESVADLYRRGISTDAAGARPSRRSAKPS